MINTGNLPLNVLYWIKDYQKFGEDEYVWQDPVKKQVVEEILGIGGE